MVKGTALQFEGVNDIHCHDCLSVTMLCNRIHEQENPMVSRCDEIVECRDGELTRIDDRIANGLGEKVTQNEARLFVHGAGDASDSATAGKTTDGAFGDAFEGGPFGSVASDCARGPIGGLPGETLEALRMLQVDKEEGGESGEQCRGSKKRGGRVWSAYSGRFCADEAVMGIRVRSAVTV